VQFQDFSELVKARDAALSSPAAFTERYLPQYQYYGWYRLVDAMKGPHKLILAPPGSGKTTRCATIELTMDICRERAYPSPGGFDFRAGIFSKTRGKATNIMRGVGEILRNNPRIIADFGAFYNPAQWNTEALRVLGSRTDIPTPTLTNLGVGGQAESLRLNKIVASDPVDIHTALSPADTRRLKLVLGTWLQRLEPGGQIVIEGHRFLPNGFYEYIEDEIGGFDALVLPMVGPGNVPLVPERFPMHRILAQLKPSLRAWEWQANYQQLRIAPEGGLLDTQWIRYTANIPPNQRVFAFFDPASSDNPDNSYTVGIGAQKYGKGLLIIALAYWTTKTSHREKFFRFARIVKASELWYEDNYAPTLRRPLEDYIRKQGGYMTVRTLHNTENKARRIESLEIPFRDGEIWFWEGLRDTAPMKEYIDEMEMYPHSSHNDFLDTTEMVYSRVASSGMGGNVRGEIGGITR